MGEISKVDIDGVLYDVRDDAARQAAEENCRVVTVKSIGALPAIGSPTNIYVVADDDEMYRWDDEGLKYYRVGIGRLDVLDGNFF